MDLVLFVRGLIIGFGIAAPVGPIGLLCIRRTLAEGRLYGVVTGLGAATADAVYALIGGLGLAIVTNLLLEYSMLLRIIGGLFLCYLGLKTLGAAPADRTLAGGSRLWNAYLTTFGLTLSNPITILSFAAIFAGVGAGVAAGYGAVIVLVVGVFSGSALWWLCLSSVAGTLRSRIAPSWLRWVNRISGAILLMFGLWSLLGVLV